MVRIREILDPELKARVVALLAAHRGMPAASIPEWFEMDDADFSELLIELHAAERSDPFEQDRLD